MRRTAPLIVGGGPAGCAAAITLAQAGVHTRVLERTTAAHDPVCGGFLGWDAIGTLDALGIAAERLGARPIRQLRIVTGRNVIETRLPKAAAGLSRRTLDRALMERAGALGASVERGIAVRAVEAGGVRLADGATVATDALFLATGKHELRGARRGTGRRGRMGLRASFAAPPGLEGWIELHLLPNGYAGLLVQEDGSANLCLSIDAPTLARADGDADALLQMLGEHAPRLIDRLTERTSGWSAIAAVPYGWRAGATKAGLYRLGDQAAVIASLAGDGIAIALASGRAAAEAWLRDEGAPAFQHAFARRVRRPIALAELLRHGAERPWIAQPAAALLRHAPAVLGRAALLTRCPPQAELHTGVVGL